MNNMPEKNTERARIPFTFMALDPYLETNIVLPVERKQSGKDFISWGERNNYPDYLLGLYNEVTTLRAIINGCIDYVTGDDVTAVRNLRGDAMNCKGDTIRDLVKGCAKDFFLYGGFALQVILGKDLATVSEIYNVDMRMLRSNKENDVFYYSEEWAKAYSRRDKALVYPKFVRGAANPASIMFVKNVNTQVYPAPVYAAAVKACEIERSVDEYHLNAINNGFSGSYIVNFNNGVPTDAIKEEIEKNLNEKFAGHKNAGRILCSWNPTRESQATIQKIEIQDFGEKYQSLAEHSRQQLFTSFRANANLFGIPTAHGFNSEEYESAFKLFNRTMIRPVQDMISDAFDKILGVKGSIRIAPFSMGDGTTSNMVE